MTNDQLNELAAERIPTLTVSARANSSTRTGYTPAVLASIPPLVNEAVRRANKYRGKVTLPEFWAAMEPTSHGEPTRAEAWLRIGLLDQASRAALAAAETALSAFSPEAANLYRRMAPDKRAPLRELSLAFYPLIVAFLADSTRGET